MKEDINILMVDDHPIVLDGYKEILLNEKTGYNFFINCANTCEDALNLAKNLKFNNSEYHLILLDIRLPTSKKEDFLNGLELGKKIRNRYQSKIIVLTSITSPSLIKNIIGSLQPNGFMIKSELNKKLLVESIISVIRGNKFFGKTVTRTQKLLAYNTKLVDNNMDNIDLKIIYHISNGENTNSLTEFIPLSLSSIERRKSKIKDILCLNSKSSDSELIKVAKAAGLIL